MLSSLLIFLPWNTLHNTMYIVYSISLLLFSDIYCGGACSFCVPALRKWMTISVLGFDSLPSSLTQMFPKIIFFFQGSNCVYVTQTNPSPKRLESILHLPFHLINRPSKLIMSHSELTKGRNENSLSHWVAETADSYTAPLPSFAVSWADHMSIRGWKTQYDDHMSSSAKSCTLSAHRWDFLPLDSISAPPFKMRRHKIQKPSLGLAQWAMPILISRPLMGWSTRFATYDILRQSWTQRPFPVEIFHLSMACKL